MHGEVVVAFSIPQNLLRAYYDGLSKLLRSKAGLEAQVYRTPVQYAQAVEDGFWAGTSKSPPHHGAGRRAGGPEGQQDGGAGRAVLRAGQDAEGDVRQGGRDGGGADDGAGLRAGRHGAGDPASASALSVFGAASAGG